MWHLGIRKNPTIFFFVIILVALAIVATALAISYRLFPRAQSPDFYSSPAVYSGQ